MNLKNKNIVFGLTGSFSNFKNTILQVKSYLSKKKIKQYLKFNMVEVNNNVVTIISKIVIGIDVAFVITSFSVVNAVQIVCKISIF